jgi:hypothetical protein
MLGRQAGVGVRTTITVMTDDNCSPGTRHWILESDFSLVLRRWLHGINRALAVQYHLRMREKEDWCPIIIISHRPLALPPPRPSDPA